MTLDLSKPEDARRYITHFQETHVDASYVDLSSGRRVTFDSMTDDDAVLVAHGLYEMEQAAQNGGIH